jgi:hypothetical protein
MRGDSGFIAIDAEPVLERLADPIPVMNADLDLGVGAGNGDRKGVPLDGFGVAMTAPGNGEGSSVVVK